MSHERQVAKEIRDEYVDTMSKIYYSYFKGYTSRLMKLQVSTLMSQWVLIISFIYLLPIQPFIWFFKKSTIYTGLFMFCKLQILLGIIYYQTLKQV